MKLNKLLIAVSIATFALASCESEFTKDAELNVNVATGDGVSFDGQTITVKSGTPVECHFNGDPDFLTFYSGEAGKEYKYRERTTVDEGEVETSTLKFKLTPQYGKPENILTMYVSADFPGLEKDNFEVDSVLVEQHGLGNPDSGSPTSPLTPKAQDFESGHEALFRQTHRCGHLLPGSRQIGHTIQIHLRQYADCEQDDQTDRKRLSPPTRSALPPSTCYTATT